MTLDIARPKIGEKMASLVNDRFIAGLDDQHFDPEDRKKIEAGRVSFIDMVEYTYPTYKTEPFHRDVAVTLDEVVNGDIKRLMLFAPPQHGKSELTSIRFPPYWLARVPDMPIGLISYGAKLALRNSRAARAVFDAPQYLEIFPHMMRDNQNWRMDDWHVANHKGYVLSAGVGGPITGHGFGLGIIDDPHESWAEAQSDTIRESVWQWYQGTFMTRLWEDAVIILMMTRWHEDDLAGRILRHEGRIEEGGLWTVKSYAALAEAENEELDIRPDVLGRKPGEPLAPSRYSAEYLERLQTLMPRVFLAEYQQRPTKPEGTFFKIGNVNLESTLPPDIATLEYGQGGEVLGIAQLGNNNMVRFARYWDLAATEEELYSRDPAYTVGVLMCLYNTGKIGLDGKPYWQPYVLDIERHRFDPEDVADLIIQVAKQDGKHIPIFIEQEPGSAGKTVIASYKKLLQGFMVEGDLPSGRKEIRATPFAQQFNAGNVLVFKAPWNKEMLNEMGGFPFGTFKDQVDALAGAYKALNEQTNQFRDTEFLSA